MKFRKGWKRFVQDSYLVVNTSFSIPSTHRSEVPDDRAKEDKEKFLDPWFEVCLNCNLPECYQDNTSKKSLMDAKKLCPIAISKRKKWTPERMLNELNE